MKQHNVPVPVFFLFSCFLLFAGCVATSGIPSVHATRAREASFTNKKTYAWYQEKPLAGQQLESGYSLNLNQHVRHAVEEVLQEKGYQKVTSTPDVLLAYDMSLSVPANKDNPALYAPGFGYSYAYESGYRYKYETSSIEGFRPVDLFKKGTLIIDFIDPASNRLIWRGWSEGAIKDTKPGYRYVKAKVEPILNNLPVR